jgi:hypothetical protein
MFLKNAWIPAIAGMAIILGCDSKPADTIPKTAPMAAKEAFELLPHLKYIAVRKDFKDIPVIAPQDLAGLYGNAWWFHNHAGQMDLTLTDEEIKGLGVEEAKTLGYLAPGVSSTSLQTAMDKLQVREIPALPDAMQGYDLGKVDKLPAEKDKIYGKDFPAMSGALLRPMFNAGLYRLLKGVPESLWNEVVVMQTTPNPKNSLETSVVLGFQGKPIIEMTARQKADKTYGIIYVLFKVSPKALAKVAAQPAK